MEIIWELWRNATNITDPWLFWPVMAVFVYLWWTTSHGRHSPYKNVEWEKLLDPEYVEQSNPWLVPREPRSSKTPSQGKRRKGKK